MRMYSPSPTVNASRVPMYMRGFEGLGQDEIDFTVDSTPIVPEQSMDLTPAPDFGAPVFSSSPGIFAPTDPSLQPLIDSGMSPDAASLLADAASSGAITNAQFQQALSTKMSSSDLENLILGAGTFATVAAAGPKANKPPAAKPPNTAQQIATAAANATKATLGPGASPRVNTTPASSLTSGSTAIAGLVVPNLVLLGVGGFLLLAVTKGGR